MQIFRPVLKATAFGAEIEANSGRFGPFLKAAAFGAEIWAISGRILTPF